MGIFYRYSTTTKGNLSIHMQSDKHLHAMQELPNSIGKLVNKILVQLPYTFCPPLNSQKISVF